MNAGRSGEQGNSLSGRGKQVSSTARLLSRPVTRSELWKATPLEPATTARFTCRTSIRVRQGRHSCQVWHPANFPRSGRMICPIMVDLFAAIRLARWFRDAAYKELPKDAGDVMIFRVCRPARYLFSFWIALAGVFAALSFSIGGVDWYIRVVCIPAFLAVFTQWPWAVVLGREGISRRSYAGLRHTISWPDVSALAYDTTSRRFTIVGKPGQIIRCSSYMVSPATFHHEMYKRAPALGPMPTRKSLG
jgi:hypothetical protein